MGEAVRIAAPGLVKFVAAATTLLLAGCAAAPPAASTHWHRLDARARDPARTEAARLVCERLAASAPDRQRGMTACMLAHGYVWLKGV